MDKVKFKAVTKKQTVMVPVPVVESFLIFSWTETEDRPITFNY